MPTTSASTPTVAIIGAGLGGIAAAVQLKRRGVDTFTIFEQSAGPGGTWWDNTYPGCECDIEIVFYAYSFIAHDWERTHASQREIQAYIERVIDAFDLRKHLRYNTRVDSAVWDDRRHRYTVTTAAGEEVRFDVVVAALGLLNVPRYPKWPGLERFAGPKFHTARWEHEHDLRGKHVAIVGTGSTASQVVPALAAIADRVTLFSREPAYVMPKPVRTLSDEERRRLARPWPRFWARARLFWRTERMMGVRRPKSALQRRAREAYERYRSSVFAERPDLRDAMKPTYPFACKRPISSSDFLPALARENVELVTRAVTAVTERGVVDSAGEEHPVDVLVMATGFQPWNFLATLEVIGRAGRSVHGVWGEQPEAFLGMQVAGFPNLFIMYGPNTNYMCVTFMLEQQAAYIARAVHRLIRTRSTAIDVRRSVMDAYNVLVHRSMAKRTLASNECSNYYHSASGVNVVTWPWRGTVYALLTRLAGLALYTRRVEHKLVRSHLEPEHAVRAAAVH